MIDSSLHVLAALYSAISNEQGHYLSSLRWPVTLSTILMGAGPTANTEIASSEISVLTQRTVGTPCLAAIFSSFRRSGVDFTLSTTLGSPAASQACKGAAPEAWGRRGDRAPSYARMVARAQLVATRPFSIL